MAHTPARVYDDDDAAAAPHPVSDPITGTRPVGPITSGPGEPMTPADSHWGIAARWIIFALLAIAFFGALAWLL
jgi:hypothetical protein